jgi:acyl-CoA synthetase (NDP forming)
VKRTESLDIAFSPKSVAIAGVGPATAGRNYLESLLDSGFKGRIYPLNPRNGEISGVPIYPNIKAVPEPVDYVISCVPADLVPQLVEDCTENRAKVLSLFTAGFSETGTERGRLLEAQICRLARAGGLRLIGPNCMGIYSPRAGLSFVSDFPKKSGRVAFVCQSGGNTIYFVRLAAERGVRFSKVISYGNACDIDESDLFECLTDDDETEIVAAYIEGVKDGRRLYEAVTRLSARKPVRVLKGGYTEAGARTAASHTGSMAGSDEIWDGLLRQAGALRVHTLEEMVDMVVTFLFLPLPRGRRVAMVGGGGGASVLASDACNAHGFTLPPIPPKTVKEIRGFLERSDGVILTNPIEFTMAPEASYKTARSLLSHDDVDLLLGNCVFGQHPWPTFDPWFDFFCDTIIRLRAHVDKPIRVVLQSGIPSQEEHFLTIQRRLVEAAMPVYYSMPNACRAIDRFLHSHQERFAVLRSDCKQ